MSIHRIGAVSFLNTKPLVAGLVDHPDVHLELGVPSLLAEWLRSGRVECALIPVIDLIRDPNLKVISNACIASDGETLTVRVFARIPPHRIRRLVVDGDSHTSIVLAKLTWSEWFGYCPPTIPLEEGTCQERDDGVLLIGDKVVAMRPRGFAFEIDLGAAWREMTGKPFVYAVWAARCSGHPDDLSQLLNRSRDLGLQRLDEISVIEAPRAGWPVEIARRYFIEYLDYRLTDRHREGMELFKQKVIARELL